MLAENSKGELVLIEVQNNNEYAYFQRMLFGTSKLVTEYINRGESYDKVRKVYSVNIVYFSLGQMCIRDRTKAVKTTRTVAIPRIKVLTII